MTLSHSVVTMSSREIAALVNSKHGDVKRSAERLYAGGILTAPLAQFEFEHNGNRYYEYRFNKRDSLVLVARLSPEFTAAVVDRWQELEQNLIPQTLPEALRLAADLAEEKQQLENQLSIAAPKAEFVDRYVKATGSMVFRQVCKLLSAKEPEFRLFLMDNRIMYRLSGGLIPHQQHIDAGRFEVKTGTNQINSHAFTQARFTPKGVRWVGGLWIEYLAKKGAA
ncbi:phage antirepressor KilAC domain-containing protein [Yersinia enterocolitica]|uniref:Phage regulatory protein n=1 Tax=Yersinia enterocolitica TaxID=630 RepID=A0ABM9S2L5_YEREN|nr:DNA-binding protein [Yersinia enterocolitica]CND97552.1 phage regulatory protein [Yersinia enterocolitica]CRX85087.1 phage regulatory protein [Yersinia enterocolitica]